MITCKAVTPLFAYGLDPAPPLSVRFGPCAAYGLDPAQARARLGRTEN